MVFAFLAQPIARADYPDEARMCLEAGRIQGENKPGMSSLLAALKECGRSRDLKKGTELHAQAVSSGLFSKTSVMNCFISMYGKCGCMIQARSIFDSMIKKNVVSWTTLVQGYAENDESELALELFDSMVKSSQVPSARTFLAALSACTDLACKQKQKDGRSSNRWFEKGKDLHSRAVMSRCCDTFVENRLIDMYAKCGRMIQARGVFDRMSRRTAVSWTSLLLGYVENGETQLALELFDRMLDPEDGCVPDGRSFVAALSACATGAAKNRDRKIFWLERGKTIHSRAVESKCCDIFVESTLVDMYAKCGSMDLAQSVFDRMWRRNVVSWTALILGYVDIGDNETALELISQMQKCGVERNSRTFVAALMACGNLMAVETGKEFHAEIVSCGLDQETMVANSLVDFYGRCGGMEVAKLVFDSIASKTIVSWTALMCGYSLQGNTARVFELFEKMREQGIPPDEVTFVCLLSACSHAGLTSKGRMYFEAMQSEFGIRPSIKHYSCMVDLLGRANLLEEALKVVRSMPYEPDVLTWKAILGACGKWKNDVVGKQAYDRLLSLDEAEASAYVTMANIYKCVGTNQRTGGKSSWIDEAGKVHKFTSQRSIKG